MQTQSLERRFAQALVASAAEVFATMIAMQPTQVDDTVDMSSALADEVIATLGFTGTRSGVFVLSTSLDLARRVAANMLMVDSADVADMRTVADSFGEVVNMVGGSFKNTWIRDGHAMHLAVPSVAFGSAINLCTGRSVQTGLALHLQFPDGKLRIDLRFHD